MAHEFESPPELESLLTRLGELGIVLGSAATPHLGAVREKLCDALALRARGEVSAAARAIRGAMEAFAALADHLDPAEGRLMRAAVQMFGAALVRGETVQMERVAELMREKSGAKNVDKNKS